jgi:hypothetical protein
MSRAQRASPVRAMGLPKRTRPRAAPALLYPILRGMRQLALVILNPNQIARIEITAARLASEIMLTFGDAPPVGALAEHGPARSRFIE